MSDSDEEEDAPILVDFRAAQRCKIPVTILTGFLGSGKTTLLSYILRENHGKKIAIIENEFSAGLGIEGMIAKSGVDGSNIDSFFELSNGCICCTVKDSLLSTLEQLVLHKDRFDYIIIETTGVANPGPIVSTFWTDDALDTVLKLDGVVCVVDAINILKYLSSPSEEIVNDCRLQISYADRILLNKCDITSADQMDIVERKVSQINSMAEIQRTEFSRVDLSWVLDIDGYYSKNLLGSEFPRIFGVDDRSNAFCMPCDQASNPPVGHSADILTTEGFRFPGCFNIDALNRVLDELLYQNGVLAALHTSSSSAFPPELQPTLISDQFKYASSTQDDSVKAGSKMIATEYGIDQQSKVDADNLPTVPMGDLSPTLPPPPQPHSRAAVKAPMNLFRIKGILYVENSPTLHILQAVNDIFDIQPSTFVPGCPEDRTGGLNTVIAIGRNIDRGTLLTALESCLVSVDEK